MKYRVLATDKVTGRDRTFEVKARSEEEASDQVIDRGFLIRKVWRLPSRLDRLMPRGRSFVCLLALLLWTGYLVFTKVRSAPNRDDVTELYRGLGVVLDPECMDDYFRSMVEWHIFWAVLTWLLFAVPLFIAAVVM